MNRFRFLRKSGRDASLKRPRPASSCVVRPASCVLRRLASDDSGVALVFTVAVFLFLFVLVLSVYSVGETIRRREALQNACDAAAHAGAVAQADALSRMAVANRALSWNYVQMCKLEMDYIVYSWLRTTCDKFAEDRRECLKHTGLGEMLSRKAGYCFLPEKLQNILTLPLSDNDLWAIAHFSPRVTSDLSPPYDPFVNEWNFPIVLDIWPLEVLHTVKSWTVINCYHNIHNKGNNRISNYIGMRSGNETKEEEIRINGYDLGNLCLRFRDVARRGAPYGGDLDLVVNGKVERTAILAEIERLYGGYGCPDLTNQIDHCRSQAGAYDALLYGINVEMKNDIAAAVRETLLQNLPRGKDGKPDESILKDHLYFLAGGSSIAPREYEAPADADGDDASSAASFFSGLRNTEQDEILFLSMADGLPPDHHVTLVDYFRDDDDPMSPIRGLGLDQWYIRCRPEESQYSGSGQTEGANTVGSDCQAPGVCVEREWTAPAPGIVRCYKNANYHDARSQFIPKDVHRGNYLFDGLDNAINGILNAVTSVLGGGLGGLLGGIPMAGPWISGQIGGIVSGGIQSLLAPVRSFLGTDIVAPSCNNERGSFPDTCAAIPESWGLVAEYEWAAAYWICWYKKSGWMWPFGSVYQCGHIPLAFGAVFGGATDNGYRPGSPFGWREDVFKNIIHSPKGHSRNAYRTECMFIDGEPWSKPGCGSEGVTMNNGHGANVGFKSYVRVYGDDKDAYKSKYYCGAVSHPWVLNERFFHGAGTIIVGLARKRRNVFESLVAEPPAATSLHAAFSPPDGSHLVALSAARAAYAPRRGTGAADGPDSFNGSSGRYDLHYDAVCKDLGPKIMRGEPRSRDLEAIASRLESPPLSIGCVCTDDSGNHADEGKMRRNANRIRRQWNLSQTDWDGVLLPLRFSRAAHREYNSNPTGNAPAPAAKDSSPEWGPFASDYGPDDAVFELTQVLTAIQETTPDDGTPLWHPLDNGSGTFTLPQLLDPMGPSEPLEFNEAARLRSVL